MEGDLKGPRQETPTKPSLTPQEVWAGQLPGQLPAPNGMPAIPGPAASLVRQPALGVLQGGLAGISGAQQAIRSGAQPLQGTPLISASIQAQAAVLAQQAAVLAQYRQGQAQGQPAAGVQAGAGRTTPTPVAAVQGAGGTAGAPLVDPVVMAHAHAFRMQQAQQAQLLSHQAQAAQQNQAAATGLVNPHALQAAAQPLRGAVPLAQHLQTGQPILAAGVVAPGRGVAPTEQQLAAAKQRQAAAMQSSMPGGQAQPILHQLQQQQQRPLLQQQQQGVKPQAVQQQAVQQQQQAVQHQQVLGAQPMQGVQQHQAGLRYAQPGALQQAGVAGQQAQQGQAVPVGQQRFTPSPGPGAATAAYRPQQMTYPPGHSMAQQNAGAAGGTLPGAAGGTGGTLPGNGVAQQHPQHLQSGQARPQITGPGPPGQGGPAAGVHWSGVRPPPAPAPPAPKEKVLTEAEKKLFNSANLKRLVESAGGKGAILGPEVEGALKSIAEEFLNNALTLGCSAARKRGAKSLVPSDIAPFMQQMWDLTIPGYAGDTVRPYKRPKPSTIHQQRLQVVRKQAALAASGDGSPAPEAAKTSAPVQTPAGKNRSAKGDSVPAPTPSKP